jgi:hypothetical protein
MAIAGEAHCPSAATPRAKEPAESQLAAVGVALDCKDGSGRRRPKARSGAGSVPTKLSWATRPLDARFPLTLAAGAAALAATGAEEWQPASMPDAIKNDIGKSQTILFMVAQRVHKGRSCSGLAGTRTKMSGVLPACRKKPGHF